MDKQFILGQLRLRKNLHLKLNGKNALICCPFHDDGTPSLSVLLQPRGKNLPGTFICFGCGKRGGWNTLADRLGLEGGEEMGETERLRLEMKGVQEEIAEIQSDSVLTISDMQHYKKGWRSLSVETMGLVDARMDRDIELSMHKGIDMYRIVFPVMVQGALIGYTGAIERRDLVTPDDLKKHPKYKYHWGTWIRRALYPYDLPKNKELIKKYGAVFLVEGSYDALNLIQRGIPALAILGTKTWTPYKIALLEVLPNLKKVFLMMDGDEPGQNAALDILDSFAESELQIQNVKIPDYLDPGDMDDKWIGRLRKVLQPMD